MEALFDSGETLRFRVSFNLARQTGTKFPSRLVVVSKTDQQYYPLSQLVVKTPNILDDIQNFASQHLVNVNDVIYTYIYTQSPSSNKEYQDVLDAFHQHNLLTDIDRRQVELLKTRYQNWISDMSANYDAEAVRIQPVIQLIDEIYEMQPVLYTEPILTVATFIERLKIPPDFYRTQNISEVDKIKTLLKYIFFHLESSIDIPFALLNNEIKVYDKLDETLSKFVVPKGIDIIDNDLLFLRVRARPVTTQLTFNSYINVIIDSNDPPNIRIENLDIADRETLEIVNQILEKALVGFELEDSSIEQMKGTVYIPNIHLYEYVLLDLISTDPRFYNYFYVNEFDSSYAKKSKNKFSYTHLGQTSRVADISISQETVDTQTTVPLVGAPEEMVTLPPRTEVLRLDIDSSSFNDLETFIALFSRLIGYYVKKQKEIIDYYTVFLQGIVPNYPQERRIFKFERKNYEDTLSSLLGPSYHRGCPPDRTPKKLTDDQAKNWAQQMFVDQKTGISHRRQVLQFPSSYDAEGSQINFGCDNDSYPYPGVKDSKGGKYPYSPCCFASDQMGMDSNSVYNQHYRGKQKVRKVRGSHIIKGGSALLHGGQGSLESVIVSILSDSSSGMDIRADNVLRIGQDQGPSSFIAAVRYALDPQYETYDEGQRKEYIRQMRSYYANFAVLAKQELYDQTVENIANDIRDPTIYFDPLKYIHVIESAENVNIFLFDKENMQIPRNAMGHIKNRVSGLRTLLIFTSKGTRSDMLLYPQSELIVIGSNRTFLNESFYVNLHSYFERFYNLVTWTPINKHIVGNIALGFRFDPVSWMQGYGVQELRQLLDSFGKVRGVTGVLQGYTVSIAVPPCQIKLMIIDKTPHLPVITDSIPPMNIDIAIQLFGVPSAKTLQSRDSLINGLWYPLGSTPLGIFIPLVPTPWNYNMETPPTTSQYIDLTQSPKTSSTVERVKTLKEQLKIITELISWIMLIGKKSGSSFEQMSQLFIVTNRKVDDSRSFYPLDRIRSSFSTVLPDVKDVNVALKTVEFYEPNLVENGRLVMYSKKFREGILYTMSKYWSTLPNDLEDLRLIESQRVIEVERVQNSKNTLAFDNRRAFETWLNDLDIISKTHEPKRISTSLKFEMSNNIDPFIYRDPEGRYYIVQNVVAGSMSRALHIAAVWARDRYNMGFFAPELPDKIPEYTLYIITKNHILAPYYVSPGSTHSIAILTYSLTELKTSLTDRTYAALLPIE
jgi:hypothetical protein